MPDIAKRMARRAGVTHAEGADQLDRVVHQILSNLRQGKSAALPGLGRFIHDSNGRISFERISVEKEGPGD